MGFRIVRSLDHDKIAMEHCCLHSVQANYLLLRGGADVLRLGRRRLFFSIADPVSRPLVPSLDESLI